MRARSFSRLLVPAAAALLGIPANASGQGPSPEVVEAMGQLSFLAGQWEGAAWVQTGPAERTHFRQTESVAYRLGGSVLVIEGTGTDSAGVVRFNAFAVVTWTPERGYVIRSWTMDGHYGEFPMTVRGNGFTWSMPVGPSAQVRYTMDLGPEGEWRQRGEHSPDGARWTQNLEMRLARRR